MTTIASADALLRLAQPRPLVRAPDRFSGPFDDLWSRFIEPNLPSLGAVTAFHRQLVEFVRAPDAILLVRQVRGMSQRDLYTTEDGTQLKATDNAPAWWVHYALTQGCRIEAGAFGRVIECVPAHLFDVPRTMPTSASAAGWHIAHIFDVKDGNTNFASWRRLDAVRRFVRNVHPCNYSLVPKADWQRWGGDRRILAFFADRYARRYVDVWDEFLQLARADPGSLGRPAGQIHYSNERTAEQSTQVPSRTSPDGLPHSASAGPVRARYRATRLLFKRDVIEPLEDGDVFEILTPEGTFRISKRDFCRVFAKVRRTASYRDRGRYHYPKVPRVAMPFLTVAVSTSAPEPCG